MSPGPHLEALGAYIMVCLVCWFLHWSFGLSVGTLMAGVGLYIACCAYVRMPR